MIAYRLFGSCLFFKIILVLRTVFKNTENIILVFFEFSLYSLNFCNKKKKKRTKHGLLELNMIFVTKQARCLFVVERVIY